MTIGQTKTPKGADRISLGWWAQDRRGRTYPRRVLRLTLKDYAELRRKILALSSVAELQGMLSFMTGEKGGT